MDEIDLPFFILQGHEVIQVNFVTWVDWIVSEPDRTVAYTQIDTDEYVSTVFWFVVAFFGPEPLFFETMVFGGEFDGYCDHYTTWEQAEAGHNTMVQLVMGERA